MRYVLNGVSSVLVRLVKNIGAYSWTKCNNKFLCELVYKIIFQIILLKNRNTIEINKLKSALICINRHFYSNFLHFLAFSRKFRSVLTPLKVLVFRIFFILHKRIAGSKQFIILKIKKTCQNNLVNFIYFIKYRLIPHQFI